MNARAVNAEPLSVPSVSVPGGMRALGGGALDERDRLLGAAAGLEVPADDLARAAVDRGHQVDPAVLGDPDRRHVEMPELIGPLDAEEPRPAAAVERPAALDQPPLAHHAQHALAVDRPASCRRPTRVTMR